MRVFQLLMPFLGILTITSTVNANPAGTVPLTDPTIFVGRKLQDYPELFLVKRTKHLNIFWSSRSTCVDKPSLDTVPNQQHARQIQGLLENVIEQRIEKFEQFASSSVPQWQNKVSRKLYPLNIRIEMETPIICGGAGQYNLGVYAGEGQPDIILRDQLILEAGGKLRNMAEAAGFVSVKMHELGHLIARAVGYPRFQSESSIYQGPLEEVIADFVGFVGNQNSPFIGEGLSDVIDAEYCSKLGGSLEPFEKAKIESICRVHTAEAMRDLRLPLQYQDLFKFPEAHHTAGHTNALLYRLGNLVGLEVLFRSLMSEFFAMDSSVFDAEVYSFIENVEKRIALEQPNSRQKIRRILSDLNWKRSQASPRQVEVRTPTRTEKAILVEIEPTPNLADDVFDFPFVNLNLKLGGRTLFSYTSMGDFWKPKASLMKVPGCQANEKDCRCFVSGNELTVDAVYLNKQERVLRTSPQNVLRFGQDVEAGCFKFGAG